MPDLTNWLLVGDFNLYRSPDDRNKPEGDHVEMYLFNEAISALGPVVRVTSKRQKVYLGS